MAQPEGTPFHPVGRPPAQKTLTLSGSPSPLGVRLPRSGLGIAWPRSLKDAARPQGARNRGAALRAPSRLPARSGQGAASHDLQRPARRWPRAPHRGWATPGKGLRPRQVATPSRKWRPRLASRSSRDASRGVRGAAAARLCPPAPPRHLRGQSPSPGASGAGRGRRDPRERWEVGAGVQLRGEEPARLSAPGCPAGGPRGGVGSRQPPALTSARGQRGPRGWRAHRGGAGGGGGGSGGGTPGRGRAREALRATWAGGGPGTPAEAAAGWPGTPTQSRRVPAGHSLRATSRRLWEG